ncbi:MAG TPA: CDGSH iron-sulfur domain-containing protein [Acidimicrobiales bacterium]|nr:CDGSH iron-sulfur domain-containing protein [Acidimicrobiales bacterium]
MSDEQPYHIEIQPDGPYLVKGKPPLTRRAVVRSEHDEPMTWRTTARLDTGETYALCRCGGSSNKPFCDGTHLTNGFDGTESAPVDNYDERATTYVGHRVVVRDDRAICEHAGFCGNRVSNVWKMVGGPAIEDSVVRAQMMAMIERCPSGALSYRMEADQDDVEPDLPVGIAVTAEGPYFVSGGIEVQRADGAAFETRNRVTLCRCGASSNKPLCDGSHKKVGIVDR